MAGTEVVCPHTQMKLLVGSTPSLPVGYYASGYAACAVGAGTVTAKVTEPLYDAPAELIVVEAAACSFEPGAINLDSGSWTNPPLKGDDIWIFGPAVNLDNRGWRPVTDNATGNQIKVGLRYNSLGEAKDLVIENGAVVYIYKRARNGALKNPGPISDTGTRLCSWDTWCVELGQFPLASNPFAPDVGRMIDDTTTLQDGDSVVLIESSNLAPTPQRYSVPYNLKRTTSITVLEALPANIGRMLRPYYGATKRDFDIDDVDRRLFPPVFKLSDYPQIDAQAIVDNLKGKLNLHTAAAFVSQDQNADYEVSYGTDMAREWSSAFVLLFAEDIDSVSPTLWEECLIWVLQRGVDWYGMSQEGWEPGHDGGHGQGFYVPILVLGYAFQDQGIIDAGKALAPAEFAEVYQSFIVDSAIRAAHPSAGFTANEDGLAFWKRVQGWPDNINQWPADYSSYFDCCTIVAWWAAQVGVERLGLTKAFNHDAWFALTRRYATLGPRSGQTHLTPWHRTLWDNLVREYNDKVRTVGTGGRIGLALLSDWPPIVNQQWQVKITGATPGSTVGIFRGDLLELPRLGSVTIEASNPAVGVASPLYVDKDLSAGAMPVLYMTADANGEAVIPVPVFAPVDSVHAFQGFEILQGGDPTFAYNAILTNAIEVKVSA